MPTQGKKKNPNGLNRREVSALLRAAGKRFGRIPGIREVGFGRKVRRWSYEDGAGLVIGVETKQPLSRLARRRRIPRTYRGVCTDVVELGPITPLICPIPHPTQVPPFPHRPGIWIGPAGACNWGSVCIFLADEAGRIYALTARHAVRAPEIPLLGSRVEIVSSPAGGHQRSIPGTVVKFTDMNAECYDVALVQIDATGKVANRLYWWDTPVDRVAPGYPELDTPVSLHAARTALPEPTLGQVFQSAVTPIDVAPLPGSRMWIRLSLQVALGDSGGLIAVERGKKALGVLQAGRRLGGSSEIYLHSYATPPEDALHDLQRSGRYVRSLPGYEEMALSLL